MLKHAPAQRQGKSLYFSAISPSHPGIAHVHPGVLVLVESHPAGDPRRQVYAGGVQNLPAELVLAVVVVVEVRSLGLGLAAIEVPPHVPVPAGLPVIVPDVPRPDLLDSSPGVVIAAADADPEGISVQVFLLQDL